MSEEEKGYSTIYATEESLFENAEHFFSRFAIPAGISFQLGSLSFEHAWNSVFLSYLGYASYKQITREIAPSGRFGFFRLVLGTITLCSLVVLISLAVQYLSVKESAQFMICILVFFIITMFGHWVKVGRVHFSKLTFFAILIPFVYGFAFKGSDCWASIFSLAKSPFAISEPLCKDLKKCFSNVKDAS